MFQIGQSSKLISVQFYEVLFCILSSLLLISGTSKWMSRHEFVNIQSLKL